MRLKRTFQWYEVLLISARTLDFIREHGPNAGEGVQACQKVTGNEPPASWCCSYGCKCERCTFGDAWPLVRSGACEDVRKAFKKAGALITHAEAMIRYGQLVELHQKAAGGDIGAQQTLQSCRDAGEAGAFDIAHFGAGWQFFSVAELKDKASTPYLHAHHTGFVGHYRMDGVIRAFLASGGFITTEGNAADPTKPPSDNGDGVYSGRERGTESTKRLYHFGCPEKL
jgi:hypothetical protein